MGQKQKHSIQDPSRLKFCEGIRGLGFGTSDGYTREQLERAADTLNSGNGLLRNGAFFVGSDGEMRVVLAPQNRVGQKASFRERLGTSEDSLQKLAIKNCRAGNIGVNGEVSE